MLKYLFILIILIFALTINGFSQTRTAPKDWKEVKLCGVSFLIPKSMKKRNGGQPIDTCFGGFKNKNIDLGFTDNLYYADLDNEQIFPDSKFEWIKIDGYKANLMTSSKGLRVHIYLGNQNFEPKSRKPDVGMGVWFKKTEDTYTARKIIESIRFPKE